MLFPSQPMQESVHFRYIIYVFERNRRVLKLNSMFVGKVLIDKRVCEENSVNSQIFYDNELAEGLF